MISIFLFSPYLESNEQEQTLRERVAQGANKKELAAELGVSRQTLYRYLGQE